MKKTLSSYFLLGLTVLSLCCYAYLHKVPFTTTGQTPSSYVSTLSDEKEVGTTKLIVPTINMVKRFLNVTKIVLGKD